MSTPPINLNKFRKTKARAEKEKTAAENRVKFGQSKATRTAEKRKADQERTRLDGHKREPGEPS